MKRLKSRIKVKKKKIYISKVTFKRMNEPILIKEKQENVQQIFYYKNETRCVVVSKKGERGNIYF